MRRLTAIVLPFLALALPAAAQKGSYRAEFYNVYDVGGGGVLTTSPAYTRTRTGSTNATISTTLSFPPAVPVATRGTGGALKVTFDPSLTATIGAKGTVKNTDPTRTRTATLTVTVTDGLLSNSRTVCSGSASPVQVAPGQTVSLEVAVPCSASELPIVTGGFCGDVVNLEVASQVILQDAEAASSVLRAQYLTRPNWNDLFMSVPDPPAGPLTAGGSQPFSVSLGPTLGTVRTGDLQIFLVDGEFRPLAASAPRSVGCFDAPSYRFTLSPVTLPSEKTPLYLLGVLSAPGSDSVLAWAHVPYRTDDRGLTGLIRRNAGGKDYWLPGVPVELWEVSGAETRIARVVSRLSGTTEHPTATYAFTSRDLPAGFNPQGKQYRIKVHLQDVQNPGDARDLTKELKPRYMQIAAFNFEPVETLQAIFPDFTIPAGRALVKDLNVEPGLLLNNTAGTDVAAETYWHLWRQAYVMTPAFMPKVDGKDFPLKLDMPLRVFLDNEDSEYDERPVNDDRPAVIRVLKGSAGAAPDLVWTYWGQHLLHELWGDHPEQTSHVDPVLGSTFDSAQFGGFWAAQSARVMLRAPAGELRFLLDGKEKVLNLEDNAQRACNTLWDLTDENEDVEARTFDGKRIEAKDGVSLPIEEIPFAIALDPHPANLGEVLEAVATSNPLLLSPYSEGLSYLQHLVELHRVPETTRAARVRPLAEGDETELFALIEGSSIAVRLEAPDGSAVSRSRLDVEFVFGPGYESLNRRESRLVNTGDVYFEMPPEHYPVKAYLSIPGSDQPPLVIDNAAYWAAVPNTNGHFLEHTFVVPPDVPQLDDVQPLYAAAGTNVSVWGRNLASDLTVTVGGVSAAVVSAFPNQLVVRVPALAAGRYQLSASRAGVSSNTLSLDVLAPSMEVSASGLDFGTVPLGQRDDRTFAIRNSGEAPLSLTSAATTSTTGDFTVVPALSSAAPLTIDPGAEAKLQVSFSPRSSASASGSLVVVGNDPVHRSATVALTGRGGSTSGPDIASSAEAMDFGSVESGKDRTATVTVQNAGGAPLTVTAAAFNNTSFTLVTPAIPFTVQPGSSQAIVLRFAPALAAFQAAVLTLASNDPDEAAYPIALSGTGVATGAAPPSCTYATAPARVLAGQAPATGTISVAAPAGCSWSASSAASFVTLNPSSGTGSGTVTYTLAANETGRGRSGRLEVAGNAVDVVQEADPGTAVSVPIVLTSRGVGTAFFTSELTLTNRGSTQAVLELSYTAAFGGGSGTASDILPAGVQLVFPDAITYLRSLGIPIPAEGNRGGTVSIRFLGLSAPAAGSATVRTASVVADGRAGLAYGSVARASALTGTAYLLGLRQNATDRSNVAMLNAGRAGDGDVVLRLTVYSGDPANPISTVVPEVGLPPGGFAQFSGILGNLVTTGSLTNGWVKVERIGGTAPYYAYAVINDQANSDGSFVPPVVAETLAGKTGITLPVAVEVSTFSTELIVTNFGSTRKSFDVTFVADAIQAPDNAATITFELGPGEQQILPDFVPVLRSRGAAGIGPKGPTYAGAVFLRVRTGDVSGLFIGARTSSPGGGGRYGLFYTGVPNGSAAASTAWLYGLQQDADNRSNVALVNTGEVDGAASTFTLEIYNGRNGQQVARVTDITLGPRRWTQLSAILKEKVPAFENVTNAYVKVTRTSGNNPFVAYAVVNDGGLPGQRRGDGAFVVMAAE